MRLRVFKTLAAMLISAMCIGQFASSASAQGYYFQANPYAYNPYYSNNYNPYANPYYSNYANPYTYNYGYYGYKKPSVFTTHPILSGSLIGIAVGAAGGLAVGALTAGESGGGAMALDTAIGAGTGAAIGTGIGMLRNHHIYGSYW